MSTDSRKNKILELLEKKGSVKVAELSRLFNISEVSVRNYLADMEKKGLLSRIHGGAVSSYKPYYSMNLSQRLETNQTAKKSIAEAVAKLISDNDTIMLNSGTTTLLVFRALNSSYHLNIVTNSIAIALEAADNPNFNVILAGGSLNTKYQFTYGQDAVRQLKNYYADKLILSVDGINTDTGFTTFYDKEADIDRTMMEQSDFCIIAADSSKFEKTAFARISAAEDADIIITDEALNKNIYEEFKNKNVNISLT